MTAPPIDVPVPGLVVLVGAAGAGKTTLATRLFARSEVLSSDALRAAISGDPADQRATRPAFGILHREVRERLAGGRLVVVDATNVEASARSTLRRLAAAASVPIVLIVIDLPAADVHARNAGRTGRIVPPDVVDRHLARLHALGATPGTIAARLHAEGFATVHVRGRDRCGRDPARPASPRSGACARRPQPSVTRPNGRARSSTQTPLRR